MRISDVPSWCLVSASGASQRHAAIPEMQQEIMSSNRTSHVTNPRKPAIYRIPEMVVVECGRAKPR